MDPRPSTADPAQPVARPAEHPLIQLVGFRLEGTDYAVPIKRIREIILMRPITRIPQVPDYIEGLINLRGAVIPIVNLRIRFGLPPRPFDEETRTIVATLGEKTVGFIVDGVTQVMRIRDDQIRPAPTAVAEAARRHIAGLSELGDRLLIILDIDGLLEPDGLEATTLRAAVPG